MFHFLTYVDRPGEGILRRLVVVESNDHRVVLSCELGVPRIIVLG